jgi:hypothetical protein
MLGPCVGGEAGGRLLEGVLLFQSALHGGELPHV